MIDLGTVALLRPWWLVAVPAVALLAFFLVPSATRLGAWHRAVDHNLLVALMRRGAVVAGTGGATVALAATAAIIALALVGPAVERPSTSTFRNLDGVVIVFDVSKSMQVGGRMPEARNAVRALLEAAAARPVALIVYAGDAYLVSPFTTDHEELGTTLLALDRPVVPDPGTRPTRAIALARRTLDEADVVQGDVVLISDGGGVDAATLREAAALAKSGHSVASLFVPAKGEIPETAPAPDPVALDALAAAARGISADVRDPGAVVAQLAGREAARLGQGDYAVLAWTDYGRLIMAASLFPALLLFRRRR
jgi:Ca-activated chloride channel family protein